MISVYITNVILCLLLGWCIVWCISQCPPLYKDRYINSKGSFNGDFLSLISVALCTGQSQWWLVSFSHLYQPMLCWKLTRAEADVNRHEHIFLPLDWTYPRADLRSFICANGNIKLICSDFSFHDDFFFGEPDKITALHPTWNLIWTFAIHKSSIQRFLYCSVTCAILPLSQKECNYRLRVN